MNGFSIIFLLLLIPHPALQFLQPSHHVPYLGTGYDLSVGNPEGNSLYSDESDPGLRPTRLVVIRNHQECPSCVELLNNRLTKGYLADDLNKYYRQIQDRWINLEEDEQSNDQDVPCDNSLYQQKPILKVGGSCKALQEAKRLLTVKKDVMVTKEISHIYMEARLNDYEYNLNPEFEKTVCSLPKYFTDDSRKKFTSFFKTWGTHVIVKLSLGQREIERKLFSEEDYLNVFSSNTFHNNNMSSSNISSNNYDVKLIPQLLETFSSKFKPYENYTFVHGSKEVPVPIRMHLVPISNFVSTCSDEVLKKAAKDYLASGYEVDGQLFVVRDILDNSSRVVASNASVGLSSKDGKTLISKTNNISTSWPRGKFSLSQPKSGCPNKHWSYGKRWHHTSPPRNSYHDDWEKLMYKSENAAIDASSTFTFEFCTKTKEYDPVNSTTDWGNGSYCIFKYGNSCPTSFTGGKIFTDTLDFWSGFYGILPSGSDFKDTRYDLCCRDDGDTAFPLLLPNKSPFVLLPVRSTCQPVFGMNSKMLWATIGDGYCISESFLLPGPLCKKQYSYDTFKIYFCYYEPIAQA